MEALFRTLGFLAAMNHGLSRTRLNFMPLNYWLLVVAFGVTLGTYEMLYVCIPVGVIFLLLLVANMNDFVVFKKEEIGAFQPIPTADLIDVIAHVTGDFALDTGHKRKFITLPCHLVTVDTGDAAFICNVDASTNYFGIKTVKRAGLWLLAVRKGTDIDYSFGKQYYGSNVFYSLQLNFVDALDLKKRTAYISCENKCDLEHMLQFLLTLAAPQAESDKPPASSGPAS